MARVFVHIGRNKTGTSAIQYALSEGRAALEREGFVYPGDTRDHGFIAYSLHPTHIEKFPPDQQAEVRGLAASLRSELASFDNDVILSTEGLQNIPAQRVAEWLGDVDARIIVYLREQAEYFASTYQQSIKMRPVDTSFEEFCGRFDPTYGRFIDDWARVFGEDRLIVRVYDRDRLAGGDVVVDFLTVVGVKDHAPFLAPGPNTNPSVKGALLEAKRRINRLGFAEYELMLATSQTMLDLANEHPEYRGLIGADPGLIEGLREKCRADNANIARRFLGRDELFSLRQFPPVEVPEELEVLAALRLILDQVKSVDPAFAAELAARAEAAELLKPAA